jgi:protein phosphatase inhibitor 2
LISHSSFTLLEIPSLNLAEIDTGSPVLQSPVSVEPPPPSPPVSPRRASFSSGINGRSSRSGSSSRSTSFSLPNEAKGDISERGDRISPNDEEVEEDEEMDEEGKLSPCVHLLEDAVRSTSLLAASKHAAFVKARGRHYSNEAEAMKVCNLQHPTGWGQSKPVVYLSEHANSSMTKILKV